MDLQSGLNAFSNFAGAQSLHCEISLKGPHILHLKNTKNKSNMTLGFMALVHGNEFLGLPILNSLIQSILEGRIELKSDIYFALGNIPAAHADKRFIEEDLNRSFGNSNTQTQESMRARELESLMLNHCDFLVDIHQTISSAENPFFIFQYSSERCLAMMEKWNPGIPVVLQEDQIGENTGLSTDEYLRSKGKFGVALELGQLGTANHFQLGFDICENILKITDESFKKPISPKEPLKFQVLKLANSFKVKDSSYKLDDGWKNLKPFTKGQKIGTCESGEVLAEDSGFMLFPRYRTVSAGQELYYYCTEILPRD